MDYEKKYKEALENARQEYNTTENVERKQWLEELFPELKESKDERIRKALIRFYKSSIDIDGIKGDDILAWLEKQGEQKSIDDLTAQEAMDIAVAKCFEQGEQNSAIEMKSAEESLGVDSETYNEIVNECIFGEQKPAWSKEDEHRAKDTIYFLDTAKKHYTSTVELDACIDWLKSLKERLT